AAAQAVLLVEVRDIRHLGTQPAFYVSLATARQFQLTEIARERHLPLVVEVLIVEHQYGVTIDRLDQRAHGGRIERPPDINPADLADKQGMKLAYRQIQFVPPRLCSQL